MFNHADNKEYILSDNTIPYHHNRHDIDKDKEKSATSSATRISDPVSGVISWIKDSIGGLLSFKPERTSSAAEKPENLTDNPEYYEDRIQEMEFKYMSKYDARKCNNKDTSIQNKRLSNDKQERQHYKSKISNKQSEGMSQSWAISSKKQPRSEVFHGKSKPHYSNEKYVHVHSRNESKQHTATQKQFTTNFTCQRSSLDKMMIGGTNKWTDRISGGRIDQKRMIDSANQKQQFNSRAQISQITAQVDVPSTLFVLNVWAMNMTNQKYHRPHQSKQMQKRLRYAEKVQAEAKGLKIGGRIRDTMYFK